MHEQIQNEFGSWLNWHNNHINIQDIDSTMLHFVREHNYKIASGGHPLVEAHAAWAEELLRDLTTKNIL
jgi:hypothetical protein